MDRQPAVYILSNRPSGTLYVGVTSNLPKRIWEHKSKIVKGFSARYNLDRLVYYEQAPSMEAAIAWEKQLKAGSRCAKVALIEGMNPVWRDLYEDITN